MKLQILSPSWRRPDSCLSHKYFKNLKYVVCESQADDYLKRNLPVLVCPDKAQGNVSRVRNWILDNRQSDRLIIVDDDMSYIGRWNGNKSQKIKSEHIENFIIAHFQLCEDIDIKYWGLNLIPHDKGAYREMIPFSLKNIILGPFGGFCKGFDIRYDETLPLKEDYDLAIQALNKYRRILRLNFAFYQCKQHTNLGGCAEYRTISREKQQFDLLQKKWGSKIVRKDFIIRKTKQKETTYDINPIIKIPIKGV